MTKKEKKPTDIQQYTKNRKLQTGQQYPDLELRLIAGVPDQ